MIPGEELTKDEFSDIPEEARRFDVELFIIHPTLTPAEISAALGLKAKFSHRVGDSRKTPVGTLLTGNYPDTRWRHSVRHEVQNQWFGAQLSAFVDSLVQHKEFLTNLRSTGGQASVFIQFFGDGYFGDEIPLETLAKLVDLGLDLQFECFEVPQS